MELTNKLTLNLGLRWDYFNSYVPAQTAGFPGETDGYCEGPPITNPWLGPRKFDPVVRRAELEGLEPDDSASRTTCSATARPP